MSVVVSFVATPHDGVFLSKTTDPRTAEEGFGLLVPLFELSVRWIEDLSFFPIINETRFDAALAYVAF